jgi:hypothetical protein
MAAVTGMYARPENRNEPFGAMFVSSDGRRSPIPEDFRGAPVDVLAAAAERAKNPVLRARLCDVCWLLDRKRATLGTLAMKSYLRIVREVDTGALRFRFDDGSDESPALTHEARDYLRRALQIGNSIGRDKPETQAVRKMAAALRKAANELCKPIAAHWFSELDLEFGISDAADVAGGLDYVLKSLPTDTHANTKVDLWNLAARAYHQAKRDEDANRCQSEAAECLAAEAEASVAHSAMLAAHSMSMAIAALHGLPGKRDRRKELQHRLVDIQAGISDEMNTFSQEMDLSGIAEGVERVMAKPHLLDKLTAFAKLAASPDPEKQAKEAVESIRAHPFASLFGASYLDGEGKVIHRTDGGGFGDGPDDPAIEQQVAQSETIRRKLVAFEIDVARRAINEGHYVSDDVFATLLQHSFFVPPDLVQTFSRGFVRFFRGDFVSATYILAPLLENSLRHVLKLNGHDVTNFDDATKTQEDKTISKLFDQMRPELEAAFSKPLIADIENVFLKKPGPYLRHQVAHGLLHDGDPYGADAIYGCWLIMRLCLMPALRYTEQLAPVFDAY